MDLAFLTNIFVPAAAGLVYFIMAAEIKRVSSVRRLMFGEIGYNKVFTAFLLMGIYFVTRPLQNLLGPHPWPMLVNCARQAFLMAVIAPAILVGIFHWVPGHEKDTSKSAVWAAYAVGAFMALNFIIINTIAIDGSVTLSSFAGISLYDATWFAHGPKRIELVLIHLISQFISPVGYFLLAAGYVRHSRHNYTMGNIYNQMGIKWKLLEVGLLTFALSLIVAGIAALMGDYYTYLWVIYFVAAIVAGVIELISVKIPPREAPEDLKKKAEGVTG